MLIFNDEQRLRAGIRSLGKRCPYCSKALAAYPLILSDDAGLAVYHAACAAALATEILVDLYTFFRPPAPYPAVCSRLHPSCSLSMRRCLCSQRISMRSRPLCGSKPSSDVAEVVLRS